MPNMFKAVGAAAVNSFKSIGAEQGKQIASAAGQRALKYGVLGGVGNYALSTAMNGQASSSDFWQGAKIGALTGVGATAYKKLQPQYRDIKGAIETNINAKKAREVLKNMEKEGSFRSAQVDVISPNGEVIEKVGDAYSTRIDSKIKGSFNAKRNAERRARMR